ncbi:Small-conductance mechanosensitive channel [Mesoflavibacter sp. HG96]|uniref:mechanosensitive ion channel domain-containing protein n=1 Tax=unclassified Mesoflavibacter TaxID=2630131 RepID=UPI000D10A7B1|nr:MULTISPECIES: mechanosensitive ion channel domain-containing protein [unclassified Mesoflavibacter]QIJ89855.1 Small-conductance mechanosensitive channel [Mesoflavibacter sp. HG96]QIJ92583.1 Small-conductance mechanosensitive channel [Mesoflavibacter sp. HG37]
MFQHLQDEILKTLVLLIIFIIIKSILKVSIKKIGQKSGINDARIGLISRYSTFTLILLFLLFLSYIFGATLENLTLVFSSVFAVIGIGLFAIWSILSNITSGIIMFFSFPYKVGDKIKIHDKDSPLEGIIEDIRAFQLHLRLDNGDLVTYPNNLILQKAVTLVQKDAIEDFGDFH